MSDLVRLDLMGWAEAFNAIDAIKRGIKECAESGPEAMLEILGNYINAVDSADDDTIENFDKAVERVKPLKEPT